MNVLITVQVICDDEEGCDGYLHSLFYGKSSSYNNSGTHLLRSSAGCGRSKNSTGTVSKVPYSAYPGYIPGVCRVRYLTDGACGVFTSTTASTTAKKVCTTVVVGAGLAIKKRMQIAVAAFLVVADDLYRDEHIHLGNITTKGQMPIHSTARSDRCLSHQSVQRHAGWMISSSRTDISGLVLG